MTTPTAPSAKNSPGSDPKVVAADGTVPVLTLEERIERAWKHQRKAIYSACGIVIAAIVINYGWGMYRNARENAIGREFESAATTPKLQAFATAHEGHPLAGLAHLSIADEAYGAGRFVEATAGYDRASAALKTGPFAARARLGSAMAALGAGKTAAAETALKKISNDAGELKAVRVEATYQLVSMAVEAGKAEDVAKYSNDLLQLDPASAFSQRAMALRALVPVAAEPSAAIGPAMSTAPSGTPKADPTPAPSSELKLN